MTFRPSGTPSTVRRRAGWSPAGSGLEDTTQLGPVVSADHLERIDSYAGIGRREGAQLLTGGERADAELSDGYFYQPTVFAEVTQVMRIARGEIFGPVLTVRPYDDPEELAPRQRDRIIPPAGSTWSHRGV